MAIPVSEFSSGKDSARMKVSPRHSPSELLTIGVDASEVSDIADGVRRESDGDWQFDLRDSATGKSVVLMVQAER